MSAAAYHLRVGNRWFGSGRLGRWQAVAAAIVALAGCAGVPDTPTVAPAELISEEYSLLLAARTELLTEVLDSRPGLFGADGDAGRARELLGRSTVVYLGADIDMGAGVGDFRAVMTGDFPVGRVWLASLFSRQLRRTTGRPPWYITREGPLAFSFLGSGTLVAAPEPFPVPEPIDRVSGVEPHPLSIVSRASGPMLKMELSDPVLTSGGLIEQGMPEEIARQIVVQTVSVVLESAETGWYEASFRLLVPREVQARVIGAGLSYLLQRGPSGATVSVEERRIDVEGVPVDAAMIADLAAAIMAGEAEW